MNSQNWQDTATSVDGQQGTAAAAKTEARELGHQTAEAGQHVAGVAKAEAMDVAHEAKEQVRNLAGELGNDLKAQAGAQQQRLSEGLRSVSDELRNMASAGNTGGTAGHLVDQAAARVGDAAGWLENREPGALLDDVKNFARQRPGLFLAVAAGAGLLAGRLTRGLTGGNDAAGAVPPSTSPTSSTPPSNEPGPAPLATTPAPITPPPVLPASEFAADSPLSDPLAETVVDGPPAPTPGNGYPPPPPTYPSVDPEVPRTHRPEEG